MTTPRKPRLTMQAMFEEAHLDERIGCLMESYDSDVSRFQVGNYTEYTPRQLLQHYRLEKQLSHELLTASKSERRELYASLYDRLFTEIPFHPQLQRKGGSDRRDRVAETAENLTQFAGSDSVFLEVGPGDCQLSFEMANRVAKVYAVDVSAEITSNSATPENFELILSDGTSIGLEPNTVDFAYSNQLMEHLHPDDAREQLVSIFRVLKPNGMYMCITPHRFKGPADVSRFFDETATGFHLKEYTNLELYRALRDVGFSKVFLPRRYGNRHISIPIAPSILIESMIAPLPHAQRKRAYAWFEPLLKLSLVARK